MAFASSERDEEPDFAKPRKRGPLMIVGAIAALGVAGAGYWISQEQSRMAAQSEAGATALRGCLQGGPLEENETSWARFRRLFMNAAASSQRERIEQGVNRWPFACKDELLTVRESLKLDLTESELKAFEDLSRVLGNLSTLPANLSEVAEPVLAALNAHLPNAAPPVALMAPLPPRPRSVDDLKKIAPLSTQGSSFQGTYTEENPGLDLPVLVVEDNQPAPLLCVFRAASLDAACSRLPELEEAKKQGLRLLGTTSDASGTLIFSGRRGSAGVYLAQAKGSEAKTRRIDGLYSFGGTALPDGSAAVLGWDEAKRQMVLSEAPPDKPGSRTTLKPNFHVGNYFYSAQLLWSNVYVRGVTPDNERRLFSLPVDGKAKTFDLVDVGEVPEAGLIRPGQEEQPHLTGCRAKGTTVIRVRGYENDYVTFSMDGKYSSLTKAPDWGTLGCGEGSATFVSAGYAAKGTELYFAKCSAAGCNWKEHKGDVLDRDTLELRPTEAAHVQAVSLQDKLLAVWLAGETGGLRMRMADPELFPRANDTVLLDDRTEGGKKADASSILGFRLYSRSEFAVLLLSSMAGVHAFRIDPSGGLEPYRLQH